MKRACVMFVVICLATGLNAQKKGWRESTFEDFVDGTFDDGGANMYVSHKGRVQMINRWDVNGDGHVDILCANSHPLIEMLDMSIYWGNGEDYSIRNHTYIPADGPMWIAADDLDNDGNMDLVVANYSNGTWTDMESFVYYGGLGKNEAVPENTWGFFPFKKRIKLPGSNAQKPAVADLNRDGYKDIVFAFSGGFWEYRSGDRGLSASRIYWGGEDDFNPDRFSNIRTRGATDVAVADLNEDEWPDLVFANGEGKDSFIYYGSKNGFSEENRIELPTVQPHAVEVGDINNDGDMDIVFASEKGTLSYAYPGKDGRFQADRRIAFETYSARDIVIEDFNRDGFTDVFFTNHQHSLTGDPKQANRLIDSFLYFGSTGGFSNENRQSLQTIGAWGANAADLNADGWTDLMVCNFQEHYSYEVPSFIYWNGPDGFQKTKRTCLYEHGAQGNAIADLNGDGHPDIVVTSMMGGSRGDYDPNYLYFGNEKGHYSVEDRIELPGRETYEQAFADMDDDGQTDILLLNRGEVTRVANEVWLYWNDRGFDPWRITGIPSHNGMGVEVADLDRNGYLDIIISNGPPHSITEEGAPIPGSFIYWGEPTGWPVARRTELDIIWTRACAVCDMNGDGHLDLVFGQQQHYGDASIYYGDGTRTFSEKDRIRIKGSNGSSTPGVADLNRDGRLDIALPHDNKVLVYYQRKNGRFPDEPSETLGVQAKTMCVADVNGDGWLDLLCPYYKGEGRRSWVSTVLLGSSEGYSEEHVIELPTDGGTGSIVSDFNRDGFQDIFFFCHREDGSFDQIGKFGTHYTDSRLYWGGAGGFSPDSYLKIPSVGVHYDAGIDIGHIRDRTFLYTYTSSPHFCRAQRPVRLDWEAETPHKTAMRFQIRSARSEKGLDRAKWTGPEGKGSTFTEPGRIPHVPANRWIQYRAIFDTDNGADSPVLTAVEITLE